MTDNSDGYRPDEVEAKWRARWAERGTNQPDLDRPRRPFYNLMMFPYPSAEGLHVGNMFAFTGSDVYGRFKRLQGHDVFEPIGFDAFGIHSENYAIKVGLHPAQLIPRNIANFTRQLERIGGMFDWRHALSTTDPEYYKWTQWLFLQLFKAGKAYKKKAAVNWCPNCKTVLANEQVEHGLCERCGTPVEQRFLEQWFFRITEYADRLLRNLDTIDWSETTRTAQRNWLGRSEGAEITFEVPGGRPQGSPLLADETIPVFTTRPDTLFGATFMVLAPEHPLVAKLTTPDRKAVVEAYVKAAAAKDLVARKVGEKEKTGVFIGAYATNPATGKPVPVWIADYVLMEYGTGAIMAVPAHDERDFAFATQFGLEIVRVLAGDGQAAGAPLAAAETEVTGFRLVNSGRFDGLEAEAGKRAITEWLAGAGKGQAVVQYRLHDWCISRQRYWGPPIPIIYCDACGPVAVPERDLPVILPPIEDFRPDDSGVSPLARHEEWYYVPCPDCGQRARRETDVSDTFLDSAWYYLRYPSTEFHDRPFDPARTRTWCPVTTYIGGNEHAVLHLLYSRFLAMVLKDLGHLPFEEPFTRFRAHGLIVKDGSKMSKSRGNVVIPDEYIAQWGADTFRMYLMFLGPLQEGGDFRDAGINGPRRFLERVWVMVGAVEDSGGELRKELVTRWHATRKKCAEDIEALRYNTAIAALMELVNHMKEAGCHDKAMVRDLVVMLAPFAPHFAEECWERLGGAGSVFDAGWPAWDEALAVSDEIELPVQVSGKTRSKVSVPRNAPEEVAQATALADAAVRRFTDGKEIRKVVYVPNRLINIVVPG
ncbi:leucine--tRNA ligase [uncultured Arthrobacter sp.]|uniref:leucine--tRNA ligase n=1 Tax=uncultured Arthrobacter sp. TaxID=114050 RepID=UPI003217FDDB